MCVSRSLSISVSIFICLYLFLSLSLSLPLYLFFRSCLVAQSLFLCLGGYRAGRCYFRGLDKDVWVRGRLSVLV